MLLNILICIIVLSIVAIGAFVLARNSKSSTNIIFGVFSFAVAGWIIANYTGANYKNLSISPLFIRLDFLLGPLIALLFWYMVVNLVKNTGIKFDFRVLNRTFLFLTLLMSVLAFTHVFITVDKVPNQDATITYSNLYYVYSLFLGLMGMAGITLLIFARRSSSDSTRAQISTMLWGLSILVVCAVVPNLIVPQVTKSEVVNLLAGNFAYIGFVVFIFATSYAIVKHRLFDVRLVVARSLGYLLSILSLASIYGFISLVILNRFIVNDQKISLRQESLFILVAVISVFTFPPLKKFFDKITSSMFYRDAYEPSKLLDDLNQALVATIDIEQLLKKVSVILESYLKAEFATFAIREGEEDRLRFIGNSPFPTKDSISSNRSLLLDHGNKVLVTTLLEAENAKLKQLLVDDSVDILARLTADSQVEGVGYLLLGQKKSGNQYTTQDVNVIEIVANELVIAIQNALQFEEIQRFNITLQEKVDTATRQLRTSNEKLKKLDETKDEFISMASHQLRTPLTSVKGYMSMVLEGDAGDINENQRKLLNQAFISSQRMVYLIADLLNVSRLKTGKFVIEPMPTNLADVVESEVEQLKETAEGRELTLSYNKPANFPVLMLDETKTRQVVMNFMDNAIHYTNSGGHITVNLEDKGETIEYTVVDDGIGVPKGEQHHLFTKFFRADNAQKARPDGTGLGLFMAKKVIVAQNGSIVFKSAPGKGSTFGFSFAKSKLPQQPEAQTDPSTATKT